jgi:hypothetical protein
LGGLKAERNIPGESVWTTYIEGGEWVLSTSQTLSRAHHVLRAHPTTDRIAMISDNVESALWRRLRTKASYLARA